MGSVSRLLQSNPLFFKEESKAKKYWANVHDLAVRHTRPLVKGDRNPIIDGHRPHESTLVKDYRIENERQITRAGYELHLSKCTRIIRQCINSETSQSKALSDWLDTRPFLFLGESKTLDSYAQDVILRIALENPNQLFVAWPYLKDNPSTPPSQGDVNERVDVKPLIIPYEEIRYNDGRCFSFFAGHTMLKNGNKETKAEVYFSVDETNWYAHYPRLEKVKGKGQHVVYDTIIWYEHNTNEPMANFLCGEYTESQDGKISYLVSYIHTYFSHADHAMAAFSDEFIVNSRYSYPIPEVRPTKCGKCDSGYINQDLSKPCKTCSATGYVLWPGPSGAIISPDDDKDPLSGNNNKPAIQFHAPPSGFGKEAYDRAWDLLEKAFKSIGLNLLSGAGASASGDALIQWQQDEQDKLMRVAMGLYQTVDKFKWHVECLLVRDEEARIRPKTVIPQRLVVLSLDELRKNAENALPENKLFAHNQYITKFYSDNPIMKHALLALNCYSPFILEDETMIQLYMAKGTCTKSDMIKKQWASIAINSIVSEKGQDILKYSKDKIHGLIDKFLEEKGLIQKELTNGLIEGFRESEEGEKVRVGSQKNILELAKAVKEGTMTEVQAEILLVRDYGFTTELAQRFINNRGEINNEAREDAIDDGLIEDVTEENIDLDTVELDDILQGYLVGVISFEDAVNQISTQTGRSVEDVENILSNRTSAPKRKTSINSVISFLIDAYDINANVRFVDINNLGETTIDESGLTTILIDKNSSFNDKATTLAHEFEHARQFISGDLEINDDGVYWLGIKRLTLDEYNKILTSRKQVDINKYELFEWEVAARDAEKIVKKFLI